MDQNIVVKVENVSKVFSLHRPRADEHGDLVYEHWALKDVSFEIQKGETIGIIGPNGSGKSTLLKILAGVTKPTSGRVSIRGRVASILDIGAGFHPELSGRENVFLNGQIHGFSRREIEKKFNEIMVFSGLEKFLDEPVKNYSNGMYLRLAFSIMTHLDFDVYLLDEVLSVGDENFQSKCISKIREISSTKKTFLIIHHNNWLADIVINRSIPLIKSYLSEFILPANDTINDKTGQLESIPFPTGILETTKLGKITIAVKTMQGINLVVSDILNVTKETKIILLNLQLSKGKFRIEFFDIFDNTHELIYSINYLVIQETDSNLENTLNFQPKLL